MGIAMATARKLHQNAEAEAALNRVKNKPGFKDYLTGFSIERQKLNSDSWIEGFIPWDEMDH